jgi:hypothetical protein
MVLFHKLNEFGMKKSHIIIVFLLLHKILIAQKLHLEKAEPSHKPFYTHTQIDINYVNYPIVNLATNGIGLNLAVVFRERWATGLSLDVTDSRTFNDVRLLPPDASVFEYTQISWMNEIILHPSSKIDFSFPLKLGLGNASFVSGDDFVFARTLFSDKNTLSHSSFFVVEPGVNVMVHLIRDFDINVGGSYRLIKETGMISNGLNFTNYSVHLGLRFRLAVRKK